MPIPFLEPEGRVVYQHLNENATQHRSRHHFCTALANPVENLTGGVDEVGAVCDGAGLGTSSKTPPPIGEPRSTGAFIILRTSWGGGGILVFS